MDRGSLTIRARRICTIANRADLWLACTLGGSQCRAVEPQLWPAAAARTLRAPSGLHGFIRFETLRPVHRRFKAVNPIQTISL